MKTVTHSELCKKAAIFLRRHGFGVVIEEKDSACGIDERPDCIGFRQNCSVLIECKTSRSDYLADAKKPWRQGACGMGNWRFYLCPKGLIKKEELPYGWGLLEYDRSVSPVFGWPPNTQWTNSAPFLANQKSEALLIYGAFRKAQAELRAIK